MSGTIVLAEDDPVQQILIRNVIEKHLPYQVLLADHGHAVISALSEQRHQIKLVILDVKMPQMGGLETLQYLRQHHPDMPVIMLTASESVEDAVTAMKLGASDFLNKPPHPEQLRVAILNALRMQSLQNEVTRLKRIHEGGLRFEHLIGHSQGLAPCIAIGRKAAISDIPVLILGETGVGKELFARAIHGESMRAGSAFVAVNCGAIPKDLIESTLFGHEKGAFTGAISKSIGKFREAEGGTIFLDEVGELPPEAQVKLLRALQQREVEPVGAGKAVPINVRVLSATHRDLHADVRQGRFREDLFFRLEGLPITLPPLRQRRQDIPALAIHFLEQFATADRMPAKTITPEALRYVQQQDWPGNVRALQNLLRRALLLSDGVTIDISDIVALRHTHLREPVHEPSLMPEDPVHRLSLIGADGTLKPIEQVEKEAIQNALDFYEGHVAHAATALGMAKSTFYKKIKYFGL